MKFSSTLLALTLASLTLAQTTTSVPDNNTPVDNTTDCDACADLPTSPDACTPAWLADVAACIAPPCNRDYANNPIAACSTVSVPTDVTTTTGLPTGIEPVEPSGSMTILPTTEAGDGTGVPIPTDEPIPTMTTTGFVGGGGNETTTRTRPVPTQSETGVPDDDSAGAVNRVGGAAAVAVGLLGFVGLVL